MKKFFSSFLVAASIFTPAHAAVKEEISGVLKNAYCGYKGDGLYDIIDKNTHEPLIGFSTSQIGKGKSTRNFGPVQEFRDSISGETIVKIEENGQDAIIHNDFLARTGLSKDAEISVTTHNEGRAKLVTGNRVKNADWVGECEISIKDGEYSSSFTMPMGAGWRWGKYKLSYDREIRP